MVGKSLWLYPVKDRKIGNFAKPTVCLSCLQLTDFVLDLSVKHVIPNMEVKIRTLYQQVNPIVE